MAKEARIAQLRGGHQPVPKKRKYAVLNAQLKNVVLRYGNYQRLDFLRNVAYNTRYGD